MQRFAYVSIISILAAMPGAAAAQETVIIGNPRPLPRVEINYDALGAMWPASTLQNARTPRAQWLPDLMPRNPANTPQTRATSTRALAPPNAPLPITPQAPAPVAVAAPEQLRPAAPPQPITPTGPRKIADAPKAIAKAPAAPEPKPEPPLAEKPAAPEKIEFLPAPILSSSKGGFKVVPEQQLAAVAPSAPIAPPAAKAIASDALLFEPGSLELTADATSQLRALAAKLAEGRDRVQLKSHASGADDAAQARRTSLKRALVARGVLIEGGIDSTRIDVRALGPVEDGGAADRIDLILLPQ